MKDTFLLNDELLWDYADGFLSAEDKIRVDALLQQHPDWQRRLDELLAAKQAFVALPLETPQAGFADRVLAAWAAEQVQSRATVTLRKKDWVIYAVAGAFGLFILVPLVALFATVLSAGPVSLPAVEVPLPSANSVGRALESPALGFAALLGLAFSLLLLIEKYFHQRRMLTQLGH